MFGIGGMELIVILVIALLVLGPERLPEVARWLARVGRELRRAGDEVRMHLDPDIEEYRRMHRDLLKPDKFLPKETPPAEQDPEEKSGEAAGEDNQDDKPAQ